MRGGKTFEELVFVEVKTRTQDRIGRPSEAVDRAKQELIRRAATSWLGEIRAAERQKPTEIQTKPAYRFDVAEVILKHGEKSRIHLIENAF